MDDEVEGRRSLMLDVLWLDGASGGYEDLGLASSCGRGGPKGAETDATAVDMLLSERLWTVDGAGQGEVEVTF